MAEETQEFTVNAPLPPTTVWRYKGRFVNAGDKIQVPVSEIKKYKFRGLIGESQAKESDVPVRKMEVKNHPRVIAQRAGDVDYPDKPKAVAPEPAAASGDEPKKNRGGRPRKTEAVESSEGGEVTE
jgi:hypothetical protein